VHSVHSNAYGETFHPVIGPVAEAEALHVRQLRLPERLGQHRGEFVIWDVGLGAAANAIAVLRAIRDCPVQLRLISFDQTLEPLRFALGHAADLAYLQEYEEALERRLANPDVVMAFENGRNTVSWSFFLDDFPSLLDRWRNRATGDGRSVEPPPAPDAILYDPFSPAKNPAMWTLPVFQSLHSAVGDWAAVRAGHIFAQHHAAGDVVARRVLCGSRPRHGREGGDHDCGEHARADR
jgi:tRNA U34 5-methylaminomethyl-2-thiouridine-forming methyltransferase MnmC